MMKPLTCSEYCVWCCSLCYICNGLHTCKLLLEILLNVMGVTGKTFFKKAFKKMNKEQSIKKHFIICTWLMLISAPFASQIGRRKLWHALRKCVSGMFVSDKSITSPNFLGSTLKLWASCSPNPQNVWLGWDLGTEQTAGGDSKQQSLRDAVHYPAGRDNKGIHSGILFFFFLQS